MKLMEALKITKGFLWFFIFLFGACGSIGDERNKNLEHLKGVFVAQNVSQERISEFFDSEEGSFFPMEDWLLDFDYKKSSRKLYLTLLGVSEEGHGKKKYSVSVSNDSIFIKEDETRSLKFNNSIVNVDFKYEINHVKPQVYILVYKNLHLELNLSDVDEKSKYSLLQDGSYVIVSDESGTEEDEGVVG